MSERKWKYIVAVFVPPGVAHPVWRDPIGKQRIGERKSTVGFCVIADLLGRRQYEDRSTIGTYEWCIDHWELLTENGVKIDCGGTAAESPLCPETLPGNIDIVDSGGPPVP